MSIQLPLSLFRRYGRQLTREQYACYHDSQMRRLRARNYRNGRKAALLAAQTAKEHTQNDSH